MNQANQQVSWLGVGRMGEAMAERLLAAGVGVQAWNRSPDKVAGLVAWAGPRRDPGPPSGGTPWRYPGGRAGNMLGN